MGWLSAAAHTVRSLVALPRPITLELQPLTTFDYGPRPIDQVLMAMRTGETRRVSREDALAVAAVQRGRNELASIATLPLKLFWGQQPVPHPLFAQFDVDVPNVVHLATTIEDLSFEGIAWWRVTGRLATGYPASVCRIDPCRVHLKNPATRKADPRYVWVDQEDGKPAEPVPVGDMIRFDSPNPGVLKANARAIRIALKLDRLTEMYADNPALREYFTDNDEHDGDLMQDEDIDGFLAEWNAARQTSPTGWVPGNVKRADVSAPSPKDLTLSDLRQQVNLSLANGLGVDPEDLGVSTTSRTYFNSVDKKQDKINRTYAPFMQAITDRLSMGDVTMRGYAAKFDLTDYLKSDPVTQATYWKALLDMGVVDETWIGDQAGIDPAVVQRSVAAPPAAPAPVQSGRPALRIASSTTAGHRFDGAGPAFVFNAGDFATPPAAPTVDQAARTITGLAVPYNAVANKYGMKYSFAPGSLEYSDPSRMAHLKDHATPVGFHRSVTDSAAGPVVELAVLDGPDGSAAKADRDQLLYDAANGLYSGLSVGVDFSMDPEDGDVEYDADTDTYRVVRATWRETSTTYMPAFDDARVTTVAASRSGGTMHCVHCGQAHAPNIACATFARQVAPPAAPAATPPAAVPPAVTGTPMTYEQYQAFIAQQAAATPIAPAPPVVPGTAVTQFGPTPVSAHQNAGNAEVNEPLPYRFDRLGNLREGTHDFSTDIARGYNPHYEGDAPDPIAAQARVTAWLKHAFENRDLGRLDAPAGVHDVARQTAQQFAITPGNVVNLNYPANRPDLYVDQLDYLYPMYEAANKGTLAAVTPFVIPKFNSSSGLVTDHVTGTEPTPGAFSATAQTVTPSALSGKVEMTREVLDQGGNPQASGLIWRQMVRGWYEGLEAAVQAFLVAQAASIPDIALGVAVTDSAMDQALASAVTALQFIRGGDRFQKVFTQIDLYQKLAKAVDTTGRPLYPSFGAMNAAGITDPSYNYLNVRGKTFVPAWATAATGTVAASSWMFDPDVVCLWASTPQRIDIQWRVAWVDIGIWGYKALAITDFTRTRELVYDPV
jgi:hypothetical protein